MTLLLVLRALFFLILIPGTVTVYIPSRILRATGEVAARVLSAGTVLSGALIAAGAAVLLRCVWDFLSIGRGTLAPVDPPRHLVCEGLYRYTRNPMYNGVLAVLLGEAWMFRSWALLQYTGLMFVIFNVVIVIYEERALEAAFGGSYRRYRSAVPRWGFTTRPYGEATGDTSVR